MLPCINWQSPLRIGVVFILCVVICVLVCTITDTIDELKGCKNDNQEGSSLDITVVDRKYFRSEKRTHQAEYVAHPESSSHQLVLEQHGRAVHIESWNLSEAKAGQQADCQELARARLEIADQQQGHPEESNIAGNLDRPDVTDAIVQEYWKHYADHVREVG